MICLDKNKIDVKKLGKYKEFIKNKKIVLKTQQRFKSGRHNVLAEERLL